MAARLGVVSVVQAIVKSLRARIFSGELAPGTPLGEVDVAAHYEVARPTAKAALENLVASGLLTRNAHQTARVTLLSSRDARDIYRTRAIIEAEAVRLLASKRQVPAAARDANAEITTLADASPIDIIDPDIRFHAALVQALESQRTSAIYAQLTDEIRLCMTHVQDATLLSTQDIAAEHARLLQLISEGEAAKAAKALEEHLQTASSKLAEHLESL
ncbi:GntR family transcriptional regulator [Glutamicibacter uratoxydans]|uniref:GntR family transcriptional regulator n=1 Tax=Glutamicibacter uratoxydans TaxID=43667 RepID=A0A4Y4DRN0_GLUUR|nr:GntR family transcriptional regulator [Glutamicibacter uratoxydans]GED07293.1 GntR family transcriptional regulator [Glutamicibacter uratoxydans]